MIVTQTPLRVGLVGGGTDIPGYYREHGGRVLNAAIDKYVYVIVKQRFDDEIYVNYSKKEIVSSVQDVQPGPKAPTERSSELYDRLSCNDEAVPDKSRSLSVSVKFPEAVLTGSSA